jgi:hypothetical protein
MPFAAGSRAVCLTCSSEFLVIKGQEAQLSRWSPLPLAHQLLGQQRHHLPPVSDDPEVSCIEDRRGRIAVYRKDDVGGPNTDHVIELPM